MTTLWPAHQLLPCDGGGWNRARYPLRHKNCASYSPNACTEAPAASSHTRLAYPCTLSADASLAVRRRVLSGLGNEGDASRHALTIRRVVRKVAAQVPLLVRDPIAEETPRHVGEDGRCHWIA